MHVYPTFPDHRVKDSKRQAELSVYRQLEDGDAEGVALYEARPSSQCKEIDFAIWITGVARYGMQVKGGTYHMAKGVWYLHTPAGDERKGSLLKQAWDSTMGLHDHLQAQIADNRNPFTVPIIVFPDMEPDSDIEGWALQAGVRVLWGPDNLVERLIDLAATCNFFYPPTAEEVAEEVELVMPGLGAPVQERTPAPEAPMKLQARQVVIQHAAVVNVYTTGAGTEPYQQDSLTAG